VTRRSCKPARHSATFNDGQSASILQLSVYSALDAGQTRRVNWGETGKAYASLNVYDPKNGCPQNHALGPLGNA